MATTASDRTLPDANILVYATLKTSPFHAAATAKLAVAATAGEVWTSRQVLREYLAAMTRPGVASPMPTLQDVLSNVRGFGRKFRVAEDDAGVTAELLTLLAAVTCGGKQVHDANIVATMRTYGIPNLLTHNVKDFNRFAHLVTVLPLVP